MSLPFSAKASGARASDSKVLMRGTPRQEATIMPVFVQNMEEVRQRAMRRIEEGPVTTSHKGDVEKTIQILNEALATEIVCVLRYMHHYFMATGVHGKSVADEFKEHADSERMHADAIAERIQQLGGKPDFNPRSLVERSASQYIEGETLGQMIREDLIAERIVIEVYQEMIRYFGNDDPTTRVMLEGILSDEEEHASDLADMLYIADPQTGETEGRDPGTDPLQIERDKNGASKNAEAEEPLSEAANQGGRGEDADGDSPSGRHSDKDEFIMRAPSGTPPNRRGKRPQRAEQRPSAKKTDGSSERERGSGWRPGEAAAASPVAAEKRHDSGHAGPPGAPGFGEPQRIGRSGKNARAQREGNNRKGKKPSRAA
jgi:bacterioferritin